MVSLGGRGRAALGTADLGVFGGQGLPEGGAKLAGAVAVGSHQLAQAAGAVGTCRAARGRALKTRQPLPGAAAAQIHYTMPLFSRVKCPATGN